MDFRRVENKYFLPMFQEKKLIKVLKDELALPKSKYDIDHTIVESLYYDNEDLHCYKMHFAMGVSRFKIRRRYYAPDGNVSPLTFMEIKVKENGICHKSRYSPEHVVSFGLDSEEVDIRDMINKQIESNDMKPMARVTYKRKSFEDDKLRVTIDRKIKTEVLRELKPDVITGIVNTPSWFYANFMKEFYDDSNCLIIEVKNKMLNGEFELPKSLAKLLNDRDVHFSKYIYAITTGIQNSVKQI